MNLSILSWDTRRTFTYPDFLIKAMTRDSLINCTGMVNDLDVFSSLKFTYKGVSGLGESASSIPRQYRQVHPSHIGRLDLNAVSTSDPGLTGMLCPMAELYDGSFSDVSEPNTWREETDSMLQEYRDLMGIQQSLMLRRNVGIPVDESRAAAINDSLNLTASMMGIIQKCDSENRRLIPLFHKIEPTDMTSD